MALTPRTLAAAAAAGLLVAGGAASTASNTVPASKAGQGAETISGYSVSDVAYTLGAGTDGDKVTAVAFTLDADAGSARARLAASGAYTSCTEAAANRWTCTFSAPVSASSASSLDVVAAED